LGGPEGSRPHWGVSFTEMEGLRAGAPGASPFAPEPGFRAQRPLKNGRGLRPLAFEVRCATGQNPLQKDPHVGPEKHFFSASPNMGEIKKKRPPGPGAENNKINGKTKTQNGPMSSWGKPGKPGLLGKWPGPLPPSAETKREAAPPSKTPLSPPRAPVHNDNQKLTERRPGKEITGPPLK